jgi:hypothetical protein
MSRRSTALVAAVALVICIAATACSSGGSSAKVGTRVTGDLTVAQAPGEDPMLCSSVLYIESGPQCSGIPISPWDWSKVSGEHEDHGATVGGGPVGQGVTIGDYRLTGTYDGERFTVSGTPKPAKQATRATDTFDPREFDPACTKPDVIEPTHGVEEWEALSQSYGPFKIPRLVSTWVTDPTVKDATSKVFVANVIVQPGAKAAATKLIRRHYKGRLCIIERDAPTRAHLDKTAREINRLDPGGPLGPVISANVARARPVVEVVVWLADAKARKEVRRRWGNSVQLKGMLEPAGG